MTTLADLAFDDLAKIVIFAIIALGALIQKILKERAKHAPPPPREHPHGHEHEHEHEEEEEETEHRPHHGRRPRLPPPPRPAPSRPVATSTAAANASPSLAPGALGGMPASPAERGRLVDLSGAARIAHLGEKTAPAATVVRGDRERTGRSLLLGKDLTRRDRVRAAMLWREVLGPPLSLREPE